MRNSLPDQGDAMTAYIPMAGDAAVARRKVKSRTNYNTVMGPVIEAGPEACRIITNKGTSCEGDFQLFYTDWAFQFLHKVTL
mgnify:FL=1